jgi:hypothetical protein
MISPLAADLVAMRMIKSPTLDYLRYHPWREIEFRPSPVVYGSWMTLALIN